jgi:hypothetical protein
MKERLKLSDNKTSKISYEIRLLKYYLFTAAVFLIIGYFAFIVFDDKEIKILFREDGLYEYFSATFFLITSLIFLLIFFLKKHILYLLLFFLFIFGFGEEISWGQRMLLFDTPEFIKDVNTQSEFNVHNLKIFMPQTPHSTKGYIAKLLDLNVLFKIFYLGWCLFLPLLYSYSKFVKTISLKINLPLPPISIGFFFLLNLTVYFAIRTCFTMTGREALIFRALQEASEFYASSVFLVLSMYFLMNTVRVKK